MIGSSPHLARRALLEYSTPKKLFNLALCEFEKRTKPVRPRSRPFQANIDLSNACSLRCPFCPTGLREFGRDPGFIAYDQVAELMQSVGDYVYIAYLYSWGEPLMHPKVADIVALVRSHRVLTDISTHLNLKNKTTLDAVCDAGLDHLKMSIDGASQEVYETYRVKGQLEKVVDNISHVVAYKRARKLRTPSVEWQFLVFDHNRHEVEAARSLAEKLGVDVFRTKPGVVPTQYKEAWGKTTSCHFLYDTFAMQVDGGVVPCCNLYNKADDFAASAKPSFDVVRNNEVFVTARKLFRPDLVGDIPVDLKHPCLSCSLVHAQPHLAHLEGVKQAQAKIEEGASVTPTIAVRADTIAEPARELVG